MLRYRYIAFEGIIGSGKSTQSKDLAKKLDAKWTREPGGDEVAEVIRKVVQGTEFDCEMQAVCEQYLYASARAQTLRSVVKPWLDSGETVISDRSVFTSVANQGYGRQLGEDLVWRINEPAVEGLLPDVVLYLDIDVKTGMMRTDDKKGDKFEKLDADFYTRVRNGYLHLVKNNPLFKLIDASGSKSEVTERIWNTLGMV